MENWIIVMKGSLGLLLEIGIVGIMGLGATVLAIAANRVVTDFYERKV